MKKKMEKQKILVFKEDKFPQKTSHDSNKEEKVPLSCNTDDLFDENKSLDAKNRKELHLNKRMREFLKL